MAAAGLSLLLFFLLPPAARAQALEADTLEAALPELRVEAARGTETAASAPFAVSVQTRAPAAVRLEPALSLEAALDGLPGLQIDSRGHFALGERISVRGIGRRAPFGTRGVQVVLDGIPLTLPDGQAALEIVEPSLIRTAELIRGPSSLFWGNASGGTLFLSTGDPGEGPPFRGRGLVGSYGQRQLLGEGAFEVGSHAFRAYASDVRQSGYRAYSGGRRTRAGLLGTLALAPQTEVRLIGAFVDQDTEHPGSLRQAQVAENPRQARPSYVEHRAGKESTQAQIGLALEHRMPIGRLSAAAYGLVRTLDNPLPFAYIDLGRRAGGLRLALQDEMGGFDWTLGADAAFQRDDRQNWNTVRGRRGTERGLDQFETVVSSAAFATAEAPIADRLRLRLGLRLDRLRFSMADRLLTSDDPATRGDQSGHRVFWAWSPALSLAYDLGPALLFAGYRTAFETPTTTELVNRPDTLTGGFNPRLDPQRVHGAEVGVRGLWSKARLQVDAALFRQRVDDLLRSVVDDEGRELFLNAEGAVHAGLELAATWLPRPALELRLSYTGSRFRYAGGPSDGQYVPGIPPHRLYAGLTVRRQHLWSRLSVEAASGYYVDDANTARADGYTLLDLHLGYRDVELGGVTVAPFVALQNVLDVRYSGSVITNDPRGRYYEPAPGRTLQAGLNLVL